MIRNTFCIGLLIYLVDGAIIRHSRDAFNPDQLMEHHMDMRTDDQTLFGSYHPNDLVEEIVEYFKKGNHDNQWGLFVYNPNPAIKQYISDLNTAGTLGPVMANRQLQFTGNQNGGHSLQGQGQEMAVPFDASNLNEQLIKSFHNDEHDKYQTQGSQGQGQRNGQTNMIFDPDMLNKELMQQVLNKQNPQTSVGSEKVNSTSGNEETKPSPFGEHIGQNSGAVYNPSVLNAGLFNGLRYDPDAINSGMFVIPNFQTNTTNGNGDNPNTASFPVSNNKDSTNGKKDGETNFNKDTETGVNRLEGANGNDGKTGLTAMPTTRTIVDNGANGNDTGSNTDNRSFGFAGNVFSMSSVGSGPNMFSGLDVKQYGTDSYNHSPTIHQQGQVINQMSSAPNGGNGETIKPTAFQPGGGNNVGEIKTGSGAPPGVPANGNLKQTDANVVEAHGIGSLG